MIPILISALLYITAVFIAGKPAAAYSLSLVAALVALVGGILAIAGAAPPLELQFAHGVVFSLALDRMSAIFLVVTSLVGILLSWFSVGYAGASGSASARAYALTFAGLLLVFSATGGLAFLAGWEIVTIAAFLLIAQDAQTRPLTGFSFRFLIMGEASSVLLLAALAVAYSGTHAAALERYAGLGAAFVVLATLGAAIKMDMVPFHIWMPGVYEQTPEHTASVLSVPVTLMGVYGLQRFLSLSDGNTVWFTILALLGAGSAFWGALQAAAARKLKTLPAYSTVENNGLIIAVLAIGALARSSGTESLTYLAGFADTAAIIIAVGHSLAKTLLFMSIGHAKKALDVTTIDETRGVWRSVGAIPGLGIVIAGLSLSAFPPLLGYTGEWMVLQTVFQASRFQAVGQRFFLAVAGVLIALAIGLGVFSMVKLIGYTALGYHHESAGRSVPRRAMQSSQVAAAALLVVFGVGVPALILFTGSGNLLGGLLDVPSPLLLQSGSPLFGVVSPTMFAAVSAALGAVPFVAWWLRRRSVRRVEPWYGGMPMKDGEYFREPAFSQILMHMLRRLYATEETHEPGRRQLGVRDRLAAPLIAGATAVQRVGGWLSRRFMNGHVYYYVLYILIAFVIVLLIRW